MIMRRVLSSILTLAVLCALLSVAALAMDSDVKLTFDLTANSQNEITSKPGEVINVAFTVKRTDAFDEYSLAALQNEIMFDQDFFEYVDGSATAIMSDVGVQHLTRVRGTEIIQAYVIDRTFDESEVFCTFQLKVKGDAKGSGVVKSDAAKALEKTTETVPVGDPGPLIEIFERNLTVTLSDDGELDSDTYAVTVAQPTGGTIAATVTTPTGETIVIPPSGKVEVGATVHLGITLTNGYTLSRWRVTAADGTNLSVTGLALTNASFTMPGQAVTVTASLNAPGTGGTGVGNVTDNETAQEIIIDDEEIALAAPDIPRFEDVQADHWAYLFVEYLAGLGFVNGKTNTLFYPGDSITRAEFVTILARMSGENLPAAGGKFKDVSEGAYYAQAVAWAVSAGITKGTSETTFSPNSLITREQIATMIARYATYKGYSFGVVNTARAFTDQNRISEYARESVLAMQQANIISGYNDGSFKPASNATRAESSKILALIHHAMYPELDIE